MDPIENSECKCLTFKEFNSRARALADEVLRHED